MDEWTEPEPGQQVVTIRRREECLQSIPLSRSPEPLTNRKHVQVVVSKNSRHAMIVLDEPAQNPERVRATSHDIPSQPEPICGRIEANPLEERPEGA